MSKENILQDFEYGVELNEDQVSSLFRVEDDSPSMSPDTEEKETEVQPNPEGVETSPESEETPQGQPKSEEESSPNEEVAKFTHNGQEYSEDDLRLGIEALVNKNDWQKSNTQKAQELAEERKQVISLRDRLNTLLDNDVKDVLGEDHKLFDLLKESESLQGEVEDNKSIAEEQVKNPDRIEELEDKILKMETEKRVDKDIAELINKHPELGQNQEALNEVLSVAIEKRLTLDDAYIFANATANGESKLLQAIEQVKKAEELKKQTEVTTTNKGVREEPIPRGQDYDEIGEIALNKYKLMGS